MSNPEQHPAPQVDVRSEVIDGIAHIIIDPGRKVYCDDCNKEYTDSHESGGLQFQSKAIGPCCASIWKTNAALYGEEHFIKGECPAGVSFADWVRQELR